VVSLVTYQEDTVIIRGLAGLSHGDSFDPPFAYYSVELYPSEDRVYSMDIGAYDPRYDSWHGFVEVKARLTNCEDRGYYHVCNMSIEDWSTIDQVPVGLRTSSWKQVNQR